MANNSIPQSGFTLVPGNHFSLTDDLPKQGTLFIGGGGNLICQLNNSSEWLTFNNIQDGSDFPRFVRRIDPASTVTGVIVDL